MARRRSLSKKDKQGVALMAVAVLGLIGLAMVPVLVSMDAVKYDEETLCPTEQAYAHTVILIDKTDPLTDTQVDLLHRFIARVRSDMVLYEKLSIYVLDDRNYSFPTPRFALCNPGTGEDASPLYQNPKLIERRFEEKFGAPLEAALDGIKLGESRPISPIMEMIAAVGALSDFQPSNAGRKLIIFSDMLQNVPDYSQYRSKPEFAAFADTPYARRQLVDLAGTDVRIIYLLRNGAERLQTNAHGLFWEKYFDRMGAKLIEIRPSR